MTFRPSSASRIRTLNFMTGSNGSSIGRPWPCSSTARTSSLKTGSGRAERAEKFADAHLRGARIVLHVFDVPRDLLWARLQERRATAYAGSYPMSERELDSAWAIFQPPTTTELADIDQFHVHSGTNLDE